MDLELTEEQNILKSSAQSFLKKECPPSLMKDMKDDERGYPQELWDKMVELGWLGVIMPEEYGGMGLGHVAMAAVSAEAARLSSFGPFALNAQAPDEGNMHSLLHWRRPRRSRNT